jgi:hypothetical protein
VEVVLGHPLEPDPVDLAGRVELHPVEEADLVRRPVADALAAEDDQVGALRWLDAISQRHVGAHVSPWTSSWMPTAPASETAGCSTARLRPRTSTFRHHGREAIARLKAELAVATGQRGARPVELAPAERAVDRNDRDFVRGGTEADAQQVIQRCGGGFEPRTLEQHSLDPTGSSDTTCLPSSRLVIVDAGHSVWARRRKRLPPLGLRP